ncbi:hypothetical protein V6K52_18240 [Knoellia sp. S7-12]|uniref:hypothetical protein n=1 Tax=Knoellia sp. S7-12 TaxID=3126698 RepID=UPI0033696D13
MCVDEDVVTRHVDDEQGLGAGTVALPKGMSAETARLVEGALTGAERALSATQVADVVGTSRVSARRYLEHYVAVGQADVHLRYGTGRPERLYRWLG